MTKPLLDIRNLTKEFRRGGARRDHAKIIRAVADVSLSVSAGEVVAVVGESGSGKTTLARCILGVEHPTSGTIELDGVSITEFGGRTGRGYRRAMQPVFQDPFSSLDPRWPVRRSVREALDVLDIGDRAGRDAEVDAQLVRVGLSAGIGDRLPATLSGGQRQRVAIAAALVCQPRLLIADEPVTALDVSVQAQILNLLEELRRDLGLAILLVSHDLGVVGHSSDLVAVMYQGAIVEFGPTQQVLERPEHPYTKTLVAAMTGHLGTRDCIPTSNLSTGDVRVSQEF